MARFKAGIRQPRGPRDTFVEAESEWEAIELLKGQYVSEEISSSPERVERPHGRLAKVTKIMTRMRAHLKQSFMSGAAFPSGAQSGS